ncbi:Cytochrome c oxidase (cbb3-type) subunit CcoO (EC 1.9.3.1) [uncultured Gammaproteobacteria bacterium]|uniref:cytochrome-c oxidase, cbb3-type subunit II n=1 Tax=Bathymodiolus heckerae thiotrophic gill symbiont TaxID=1052212 RepID=UPI0010BAFCA3|nr:cytochrome-c oxidase, cbb3-type subunit II [Bathymodiolus heckerae thiotrophic gill symbiont]CAC9602085.1 Cytochrome c oxidase (cbb3-type) subunit CcoO (EC 1.9.3.1) [uncultured Gammaproteobacteria bacterium]CAC9953874.1 Cytochrome c oxidase (cbb3-type) subunit CcoO (EC 1.9.3.1) [uncultured Gammaproteobacteria bacterium]CAC9955002.1 Cytochrome c oxidase (cbb3-type) subunit CcoO (EC 1.9.3.1) [uncultured Gammaproteobacteria bacterium]SHN91542.1 Cytochrome c oxidase subunit CcoO [Bathymodiolus h
MSNQNGKESLQTKLEKNIFAMYLFMALSVSLAGIVQIVPLFTNPETVKDEVTLADGTTQSLLWQRVEGQSLSDWKPGDGVRPNTPLEVAGRDIYQREGCYLCHSQMIRPFRDENERYGHFSLAVESKYDHPFQWGSKRTGPDLARVGGKYSDEWHILHLRHPQALVPESVMPKYKFLDKATVDGDEIATHMSGLRKVGVPYTDADIAGAAEAVTGKTEMDAMVAYLQSLGNMIKFENGVTYRE